MGMGKNGCVHGGGGGTGHVGGTYPVRGGLWCVLGVCSLGVGGREVGGCWRPSGGSAGGGPAVVAGSPAPRICAAAGWPLQPSVFILASLHRPFVICLFVVCAPAAVAGATARLPTVYRSFTVCCCCPSFGIWRCVGLLAHVLVLCPSPFLCLYQLHS